MEELPHTSLRWWFQVWKYEYKKLIEHAFEVRNGKELETSMLYKNMSYINKEIIAPIKSALKLGDKIVI